MYLYHISTSYKLYVHVASETPVCVFVLGGGGGFSLGLFSRDRFLARKRSHGKGLLQGKVREDRMLYAGPTYNPRTVVLYTCEISRTPLRQL